MDLESVWQSYITKHADRAGVIDTHYQAPEEGRPANPDATHFSRLPGKEQDSIRTRVESAGAKYGLDLSHPTLVNNIKSTYLQAKSEDRPSVTQGGKWYREAHQYAQGLSEKYDIPLHHAVGAIAATSPQAHWEENKTVADYTIQHALGGGKLELSPRSHILAQHDIDSSSRGRRSGVSLSPGKPFDEMGHEEAGYAIKAQAQHTHGLLVPGRLKLSGEPWKATFSTGTGSIGKAVRIARGEDPADVLSGHKVRSFHNNILDYNDKSKRESVTMDTHAVSLASRAKMGASSPALKEVFTNGSRKGLNLEGSYSYFADAYRQAHQELVAEGHMPANSKVHHLQAATWLHWRNITDEPGPLRDAHNGEFPEFSVPKKQQELNKLKQREKDGLIRSLGSADHTIDPSDYEGEDPDFDPELAEEAKEAEWRAEPEEMRRRLQPSRPEFDDTALFEHDAAYDHSKSEDYLDDCMYCHNPMGGEGINGFHPSCRKLHNLSDRVWLDNSPATRLKDTKDVHIDQGMVDHFLDHYPRKLNAFDEWLFHEADYPHGGQTPSPKPDSTGVGDTVGNPEPSQWWQDQHSTGADNPASTGPLSFRDTLDPNEYASDHGLPNPDEDLLAPGPALTSQSGPDFTMDYTAFHVPPHTRAVAAKAPEISPQVDRGLGGHMVSPDSMDISKAARAHLAMLSPQEQMELINEGENVKASNLDRLDLSGTHYSELEARLQAEENDDDGFLW